MDYASSAIRDAEEVVRETEAMMKLYAEGVVSADKVRECMGLPLLDEHASPDDWCICGHRRQSHNLKFLHSACRGCARAGKPKECNGFVKSGKLR